MLFYYKKIKNKVKLIHKLYQMVSQMLMRVKKLFQTIPKSLIIKNKRVIWATKAKS
jgi:hypothetical protein